MANHRHLITDLALRKLREAAILNDNKKQAQAILDAYSTLADLRDRSVSESEMLAAALRETINQCQDSRGMISAPELLRIAAQLDQPDTGSPCDAFNRFLNRYGNPTP